MTAAKTVALGEFRAQRALWRSELISSNTSRVQADKRSTTNGRIVLSDRYVGAHGVTLSRADQILLGWFVDLPPIDGRRCATLECHGEKAAGKSICVECYARHYVPPKAS